MDWESPPSVLVTRNLNWSLEIGYGDWLRKGKWRKLPGTVLMLAAADAAGVVVAENRGGQRAGAATVGLPLHYLSTDKKPGKWVNCGRLIAPKPGKKGPRLAQAPSTTNFDVHSPTWGDVKLVHPLSAMRTTSLGLSLIDRPKTPSRSGRGDCRNTMLQERIFNLEWNSVCVGNGSSRVVEGRVAWELRIPNDRGWNGKKIEMAKPRSDDMMTFQISLYSVKDPELLKDGADSSHHLRDITCHVITTKATTTSRTEN
ncbi:hypothetical protein NC651_015266 [Populus alba x Populus x berolinensis]|nr:hypothetical protein NC651_015266 [Populus alba x Populus x berolinensis]